MTASLPAPLAAYRLGTRLLGPALPLLLRRRARAGKEEAARLPEREGIASRARPAGDLVWAHGASIGESLSLIPLVEALVARGLKVLVTSGTRTSAEILARRLPPGAHHQFMPADVPRCVARFLDHWRPAAALFAESELWPNTVVEIHRRGVPLLLVNARLSARSAERWARLPSVAEALFGRISLVVAQSRADADRIARLGGPVAEWHGNLKFDIPPPPADPGAVERLSGLVAGRPVWIAASTHPGEEEDVLQAHLTMRGRLRRLLTVVVPRHPGRAGAIATLAEEAGLAVGRRSQGDATLPSQDIHLVDSVGELGLFFRLAPLAFMGGSLVPHGGQNPIEPARLGAAILHGPHTGNFLDVYDALDRSGGALEVADGPALAAAAGDLLSDPGLLRDMTRQATATVASFAGAVDATMALVAPYLPPARDPRDAQW